MSQRTWQAPASRSTLPRSPDRTRSSQPDEPNARPGPASGAATASGADTGTAAEPGRPAGVRLTGRGALIVVFALCLVGLAVSGWLHWGIMTGLVFVAASVLAAARTQRSDLLVVAVTPPALFLIAVICVKALGSAGDVLSTLEGTLITLANTAPWLIIGTVLSLIVAFSRGMWDNIRTLRKDLRGDPIRRAN
ncbi:MAG TPA: DUF6542 domain-containing protein [Streptosporangiaceae bacterium]